MVKSRAKDVHKLTEANGTITKNYCKLGKRIDKVFPLLDPELSFDEAKK